MKLLENFNLVNTFITAEEFSACPTIDYKIFTDKIEKAGSIVNEHIDVKNMNEVLDYSTAFDILGIPHIYRKEDKSLNVLILDRRSEIHLLHISEYPERILTGDYPIIFYMESALSFLSSGRTRIQEIFYTAEIDSFIDIYGIFKEYYTY